MSEKEIREHVIVYLKETFGVGAYDSCMKEFEIPMVSRKMRADLAFLCHTRPIVLVECKRSHNSSKGKEQLTSYMIASPSG